jgi:pimeloyl-ACP methyl ester carboxylesterase
MLRSNDSGTGAAVVLVHGVGVGPESFDRTASALTARGHHVQTAVRSGYGDNTAVMVSLDDEVDHIIGALRRPADGTVVWVGVSGGATLGLVAASRQPAVIDCAVLHEPLVGACAADLHERVQAAARLLAFGPDDPKSRATRACEFVAGLIGPEGWDAIGRSGQDAVAARAEVLVSEVPRFAAFDATALGTTWANVVITVGERSPDARHEAAAVAAALTGGEIVVIPGVGHLPQVQAPDVFAERIASFT